MTTQHPEADAPIKIVDQIFDASYWSSVEQGADTENYMRGACGLGSSAELPQVCQTCPFRSRHVRDPVTPVTLADYLDVAGVYVDVQGVDEDGHRTQLVRIRYETSDDLPRVPPSRRAEMDMSALLIGCYSPLPTFRRSAITLGLGTRAVRRCGLFYQRDARTGLVVPRPGISLLPVRRAHRWRARSYV